MPFRVYGRHAETTPVTSNYFLDSHNPEQIYFASVILTNATDPDLPPIVISAVELMREERFLSFGVADTSFQ